MNIPEILKKLEPYTGKLPRTALQAAIEQRESITPELLRIMESVAADPTDWAYRPDHMLHVFALFLLAQFREKSAYPLLVKILSTPGEVPIDLFDATISEGLSQILASVYDGDETPLHALVESEDVNQYVRSSAIDTFLVLERTGQMPRERVLEYLRSLFHGKLQRTPSFAWSSLVCTIAALPAPELLEEVRKAYAEGLVDTTFADIEETERDILAPESRRRDRLRLITDAIAEMERWPSFHLDDYQPKTFSEFLASMPLPVSDSYADDLAPLPYLGELMIGRNEPCLCRSGKKYKKCCGK